MTITDLPRPAAPPPDGLAGADDRWQPTRAGIINVWQYTDETFEFAAGRLLLFGANGSGKTMALELLAPYLLDANATASRLSTAGGHERGGLWQRVSGYGDTNGHVGYLWMEFGRRSPHGHDEWFTCGTRLEVRTSGGRHGWFTTSRRVGMDLHLLGADRVPLTLAELRSAVGDAGTVWGDDTSGYRNTVRATLYAEFRPEQYQTLIDALLAVRKQSITDNLSPTAIHELLTGGLPALDPAELDGVARGFEQLDARRDTIAALDTYRAAAVALERRVRHYSSVAMRLLAKDVSTADSQFDGVRRRENTHTENLATASAAREAAQGRIGDLAAARVALQARHDAILVSPQYANISQLDAHRQLAANAAVEADRAEQSAATAAARAATADEAAAAAAAQVDASAAAVLGAVGAMRAAARDAGVDTDPSDDPIVAATRVADGARQRDVAVDTLEAHLARHERAVDAHDHTRRALDSAEEGLAERERALAAARVASVEREREWADAVGEWAEGLVELAAGRDAAAAAADAGNLDTFAAAVSDALRARSVELGRLDENLAAAAAEVTGRRQELCDERDRLTAIDATVAPQTPPWRATRDPRRAGAALWELVGPVPDVDDATLDGIESALDAAGALDAWIHPDGSATSIAGDIVAAGTAAGPERRLSELVEVDVDAARTSGVAPDVVRGVLDAIGFGPTAAHADGRFTVGADGTFCFGPAVGAATVRTASLLGAAARERGRLARIAAIDATVAELDTTLADLAARRDQLARRGAAANAERDAAPSVDVVRRARRDVEVAQGRVVDAADAVTVATAARDVAANEVRSTSAALHRAAAQWSLPTTRAELSSLRRQLRDLDGLCRAVHAAATDAAHASERADATGADATQRRTEADSAAVAAGEARLRSDAAAAAYAQLEESVGADAATAQAELSTVSAEMAATDAELADARRDLEAQTAAHARAEEALERSAEDRRRADAARQVAVRRFRDAVVAGVADDAGIVFDTDTLDSLTAVVSAASSVRDQVRADATSQMLAAALVALTEEQFRTQAVLGGSADLSISVLDDSAGGDATTQVSVAAAVIDGTPVSVRALVARFDADVERARAELEESETRLFEQTLTGSLRTHLASRLRAAHSLVENMNSLLGQISSAAAGVGVSLRWEVSDTTDDAATLTRVKQLLLRDHHSPDERDELFGFLTRRIDLVRGDDASTTSWRDALEALFDYRLWHRFVVMVRHVRFGDRPMPLTSRKVSLSAGEKAMVLSLPLFAAIAAHYTPRDVGGDPLRCPRLLLLDEVFPKNDRANKRQILGLLTRLDLDCILTSDKDMCDYDTIDAMAIAAIAKAGDVSYATRWVWNGTEIVEGSTDAPIPVHQL